LPKDALGHLLDVAEIDTAAAIWQPVILSPNGDVENAGAFFTWSGFLVRRSEAPAIDAQPYASFSGSGACLLVRRDVFESLGGFQDSYFAYIEDVDLCWRARLAGWEIRVIPGIRVQHEMNATTKRIFAAHEVRYMNFRNRLRTIGANASASTLIRVLPIHILACLATAVVLAVSGRFKSAYAVLRAVVWPLTHGPEIRAQRRGARAFRKREDREVLRDDLVVSFSIRDSLRLLRDHRLAWRGP
jgi:GT2 family glycosyltransferase